jgi:hypothetical protein
MAVTAIDGFQRVVIFETIILIITPKEIIGTVLIAPDLLEILSSSVTGGNI